MASLGDSFISGHACLSLQYLLHMYTLGHDISNDSSVMGLATVPFLDVNVHDARLVGISASQKNIDPVLSLLTVELSIDEHLVFRRKQSLDEAKESEVRDEGIALVR